MAISTIGTDALASAAVTSAKLASGAPSTSQLPAGTVLQVVNVIYTSNPAFSSASYVDTGLTASITPSSATSKILVIASHHGIEKTTSNNTYAYIKIVRNSTDVGAIGGELGYTSASTQVNIGSACGSYLDSPATTSSTTYKTQVYVAGGGPIALNYGNASITLMEIAA